MKKTILSLAVFLMMFTVSWAQGISGKVYYQSKTSFDKSRLDDNKNLSEAMKNAIYERVEKAMERTYILTFDQDESLYKEQVKVGTGKSFGRMKMMLSSFGPGTRYKNLKKGTVLIHKEFFGKPFLISDSIPKIEWKITSESKQIGHYVAFKAIGTMKIDSTDFRFANPKKKDSTETKKKSTDIFANIEIPDHVKITAWFTPQIPVSNGPGAYGGLPGLILEMNAHKTTLIASKIELSTKAPEAIKPPSKGQKVTREEYQKIITKKLEDMKERFQNRRGNSRKAGF